MTRVQPLLLSAQFQERLGGLAPPTGQVMKPYNRHAKQMAMGKQQVMAVMHLIPSEEQEEVGHSWNYSGYP